MDIKSKLKYLRRKIDKKILERAFINLRRLTIIKNIKIKDKFFDDLKNNNIMNGNL